MDSNHFSWEGTGLKEKDFKMGQFQLCLQKLGKTPLWNLVNINNVEEQCKVKHLYLANEGIVAQLLKERTFIEFFE